MLCGNSGLLVICWKLYDDANVANSWEAYCGPLSLMMVTGIPCLEVKDLNSSMMLADDVDLSLIVSKYQEK